MSKIIASAAIRGAHKIVERAEDTRPCFRRLRELRDTINDSGRLRRPLSELSMGMTQDFEVAVEEGATMVRIGSALFRGILT